MARSEPRGVTPPAANNAFSGVESELMSYAPGCATSPTTYTRTVLSRERDTSAETFRYWVLSTCCTACCVSPRLRPLTRRGPASGSDTRPSLSTRRNIRWETPPQRSISRPDLLDRKSTRLNSSHLVISYAVFCLKKKKRPHLSHNF